MIYIYSILFLYGNPSWSDLLFHTIKTITFLFKDISPGLNINKSIASVTEVRLLKQHFFLLISLFNACRELNLLRSFFIVFQKFVVLWSSYFGINRYQKFFIFELFFSNLRLICRRITFGNFSKTMGISKGPKWSESIPIVYNALTLPLTRSNKFLNSLTFEFTTFSNSIQLFMWGEIISCGFPQRFFNKVKASS